MAAKSRAERLVTDRRDAQASYVSGACLDVTGRAVNLSSSVLILGCRKGSNVADHISEPTWSAVGVASVVDALAERGIEGLLDVGRLRVVPRPFAGPAITLRITPVQASESVASTEHWNYMDQAPAGSVLVVATGGAPVAAIGGVTSAASVARGVVGAVTDGAIRDTDEIAGYGFPIHFQFVNPRHEPRQYKWSAGGEVLEFGDVAVAPGDLIVADGDGVVAVPQGQVGQVMRRAAEIERLERTWADHARAYRSIAKGYAEVSRRFASASRSTNQSPMTAYFSDGCR